MCVGEVTACPRQLSLPAASAQYGRAGFYLVGSWVSFFFFNFWGEYRGCEMLGFCFPFSFS